MAQIKPTPTPGPWFSTPTIGKYGHVSSSNTLGADCGGDIAVVWGVKGNAEADARLIAEAGTVAHETGLTPRQLAEQRAELLAEAIELLRNAEYADGVATVLTQDCEALQAAIAKATTGGPS